MLIAMTKAAPSTYMSRDRTSLFVCKADHRKFSAMAKRHGVSQGRLFRTAIKALNELPEAKRLAMLHASE